MQKSDVHTVCVYLCEWINTEVPQYCMFFGHGNIMIFLKFYHGLYLKTLWYYHVLWYHSVKNDSRIMVFFEAGNHSVP